MANIKKNECSVMYMHICSKTKHNGRYLVPCLFLDACTCSQKAWS